MTDPLMNARTELLVTRDDLRAEQRTVERERTRIDSVRDRLAEQERRHTAAVAYIRHVHGDDDAAAVRNILAGTSHYGGADTGRSVADFENELLTVIQMAGQFVRTPQSQQTFTEVVQKLVDDLARTQHRLEETMRKASELQSSRHHAVEELVRTQMSGESVVEQILDRTKNEYQATVDLIDAELPEYPTDGTDREKRIWDLLDNIDGSGTNAKRVRSELAQAQATLAQLRHDHPADIR